MSWKATRRALRWVFASGVAILIVLQVAVSAQEEDPGAPPVTGAVKVELEAEVDGEEATFSWLFDGEVEDATCTLDPHGDATLDVTITDCDQQREVDFLYEEPGVYFAELLVRTRDGRSGRAIERVEVR